MNMSRSSSLFASDYSLTPTQSRDDPAQPRLSPSIPQLPQRYHSHPSSTTSIRPMHASSLRPRTRASMAKAPTPPSPRIRTSGTDCVSCMESELRACLPGVKLTAAGSAHETRSQALGHTGPGAERHLRAAAGLFEAALAQQPGGWAALRLATVLYHLSTHCRRSEAVEHLRAARALAAGSGPALETRAAICARLSALLRAPGDDLTSEAGEAATSALDAFEDVAAEKMDYASSLSKGDFELEAPGLAATFLALAEAAAAVSTLSDPDGAEPHAELADHALAHAANMASLARAPALVTHIQLVGARIAADRLAFYARWEDVNWDDLLSELSTLASQTRELAQQLRGSRGAAAAEQAAEAVKLLADARVMHAGSLGKDAPPPTPGIMSARSSIFATSPVSVTLATPHTAEFSPPDHTPGLSSSSGSWLSSTGSPPIPEEPEEESSLAPAIPDPAAVTSPRKRAPPPPPLKLVQRPPRPVIQPLSPLYPPPALSPLNPARQATRPRLVRNSSSALSSLGADAPLLAVQVQWNELASAGKSYKLALSLLSAANLPPHDRARRKSDLLFAVAAAALARAALVPRVAATPGIFQRANSGSYFSPTAPHASPESLRSLNLASRRTSSPRVVPPTPRHDPRSGVRATGAAALRATAEVYAAWAAREVGWSAVIDPRGRVADRRTGTARGDEAGMRAVLLALRVWWVRAVAGDGDGDGAEGDESGESGAESPAKADESRRQSGVEDGAAEISPHGHKFGVPPSTARRIAGVLRRLRDEGADADDVRRFVAPLTLGEDEGRFWAEVEDELALA
ncbi:unnamed protein product [Cutaneotrichosporon oleaginosum]